MNIEADSLNTSQGIVYGLKERTNGLQCPWSLFQILAFVIFGVKTANFYVFNFPNLLSSVQFAFAGIYTVLLLILVFLVYLTMFKETRDNVLLKEREAAKKNEIFQTNERLYCVVCKGHVEKRTKHCGICSKCCFKFDHHCKWLNSCIGGRNYSLFIWTSIMACVVCIVEWGASASVLVYLHIEEANWLFFVRLFMGSEMKTQNDQEIRTIKQFSM